MRHKELCETLVEYIELYEHNSKETALREYADHWKFRYTYNVVLIKTGYKFSTYHEFLKLCESDAQWPIELQLKENPEIRVNVFQWSIINGESHKITIWNDSSSIGMFYKDIVSGKPGLTKDYLTSIEELKKCIFAAAEGRYYVPIEISNITSDEDDIVEDPEVAEDIADILSEDKTDENIDSYTNEELGEIVEEEENSCV